MTQKTTAALKTQTDANVTSNSNKENTGAQVRALLNDFADSSWNVLDNPIASQVEAEAGTATDRFMTPQRTAQAIQLSLNGLLDGAPAALDTLNELAAAIADDADYAASIATALAGKAAISHTHDIADVTGLQTALDGKPPNARAIATGTGLIGGGDLSADHTLAADIASAAQIRSNTADKLLTTPNVYAAMAPVTLTSAATVAWDMSAGILFDLVLDTNAALGNPTNVPVGKSGLLRVVQDGTGNRTLGLPSNIKMADGGAPDLSTAANEEDLFTWVAWTATKIYLLPGGKAFS